MSLKPDGPAEAVTQIRRSAAALIAADDELPLAVAHARELAVDWTQIALALGMRQPNAVRKYKKRLDVKVTVRSESGSGQQRRLPVRRRSAPSSK